MIPSLKRAFSSALGRILEYHWKVHRERNSRMQGMHGRFTFVLYCTNMLLRL